MFILELCVIPEVLPVQDSCNCLAASTLYNYGYPEIQEISPIDPYYYHRVRLIPPAFSLNDYYRTNIFIFILLFE